MTRSSAPYCCKPHREECDIGVIFFNNVGYLGMCGHGTIGVIVSLAYLGMLKPGAVKIDTPVGVVEAQLQPDGSVAVANVPSYRKARAVSVDVPGVGVVTGDVAYGGNWFFLVENDRIPCSSPTSSRSPISRGVSARR